MSSHSSGRGVDRQSSRCAGRTRTAAKRDRMAPRIPGSHVTVRQADVGRCFAKVATLRGRWRRVRRVNVGGRSTILREEQVRLLAVAGDCTRQRAGPRATLRIEFPELSDGRCSISWAMYRWTLPSFRRGVWRRYFATDPDGANQAPVAAEVNELGRHYTPFSTKRATAVRDATGAAAWAALVSYPTAEVGLVRLPRKQSIRVAQRNCPRFQKYRA